MLYNQSFNNKVLHGVTQGDDDDTDTDTDIDDVRIRDAIASHYDDGEIKQGDDDNDDSLQNQKSRSIKVEQTRLLYFGEQTYYTLYNSFDVVCLMSEVTKIDPHVAQVESVLNSPTYDEFGSDENMNSGIAFFLSLFLLVYVECCFDVLCTVGCRRHNDY